MSIVTADSPSDPAAREQARRRARQDVKRAWHTTGWSENPSKGVDYQPLDTALRRYVQVTYDTSQTVTSKIVSAALRAYLAPLHARRVDVALLSHEGLLGEVDDQALEHTHGPSGVAVDSEHVFGVTRGSNSDDSALTTSILETSPEVVRRAMSLIPEAHQLEFVIMTEYLDTRGNTPTERISNVANSLQRQRLLAGQAVSTEVVRTLVGRFARRVKGLV